MTGAVLLLALLLAGPNAAAAPPDPELARSVEAYIAPYVAFRAFSGVILVAKRDSILLEKAWGMASYEFGVPNTPDTRFRIASITKRFTQVVIARLVEEKELSLSDRLAKFCPSFPKAEAITIDQLVGHRSGIRDPDKLRKVISVSYTPAEVVDLLALEPLGSEPGKTYSYTTANYAVLAYVIEKVTGRTFAETVRKYVYEPAGMTDSGDIGTVSVVPRLAGGYMPDPYADRGAAVNGPEDTSWKIGGGSGYATARDLHRFLRAFYGKRLLSSTDPVSLFPHDPVFGKRASQSSGAFPGANAHMIYFPNDELAVVVMSNSYSPVAGSIARDVAAMVFGQPYKSPVAPASAGTRSIDSRLFGSWTLEGFPNPFSIEMRHGRAVLSWSAVRQSAILRAGDDSYFCPLDWATVVFRFGRDGPIDGTWTAPWSDKPLKVTRRVETGK
jgi:CubicO group peptidase (beta-lactamase class C family)